MQFRWFLVCAFCLASLGCGKDQGATTKLPAGEETAPEPGAGQDTTAFDTAPEAIQSVTPIYPEGTRVAGLTGTTQIEVSIDASGTIVSTRVALSSGDARLDRAAEDAAKQWTFKPATRKGEAVPSTMILPFRFELH